MYSCDCLPEKDLLTIAMQTASKTTLFVFNFKTKQVLLQIDGMSDFNEWYYISNINITIFHLKYTHTHTQCPLDQI